MADLSNLTAAVQQNTAVTQQVVAVLQNAGTDQATIQTLTDQLNSNNSALTAAIAPAPPAA